MAKSTHTHTNLSSWFVRFWRICRGDLTFHESFFRGALFITFTMLLLVARWTWKWSRRWPNEAHLTLAYVISAAMPNLVCSLAESNIHTHKHKYTLSQRVSSPYLLCVYRSLLNYIVSNKFFAGNFWQSETRASIHVNRIKIKAAHTNTLFPFSRLCSVVLSFTIRTRIIFW